MLTLKLFGGWLANLAYKPNRTDLLTWARIEYKQDADYAYHHMMEHGVGPNLGVKA